MITRELLKQHNLLPAPMEGVMRPVVISACNALNLTGIWITPFFRVSESVPKLRELKKFMAPFGADGVKVILQLMGTDPEKLAETARRGMEAGADGIDLNCGCPSNQVVRHGAGAGSMRSFDNTARIIEAIRNALPQTFFSIKTRLGFENTTEAEVFLPLWENAGSPDLFTLHYRTAREGYRQIPGRNERLNAAAGLLKNALVFGNGDISSAAEAASLELKCCLDGVLIGRGFWRDPWIVRRNYDTAPELPSPDIARRQLWQLLKDQPYTPGVWSRGNAIEMASLIWGYDSPEAQRLKSEFKLK